MYKCIFVYRGFRDAETVLGCTTMQQSSLTAGHGALSFHLSALTHRIIQSSSLSRYVTHTVDTNILLKLITC